ncbi:MAG: cell wall metabolism sensor histidine kinase WalK, partial [Solibacillus isronensis]
KTNFQDSIRQRIELVHYSVREEMLKVRDENTPPTIEYSLKTILEGFSTEDINKINVVDRNDRILATSDDDQTVVGQRINEEIIQQAASSETLLDKISLDRDTGQRIWILAVPIMDNAGPKEELKGVIYVQSNIEKVYEQLNEINRIFAAGIAVSLAITIILGILVARTITRP